MIEHISPPSPELNEEQIQALAPLALALGKAKLRAQPTSHSGSLASSRKGHGLELHDIRPYHASDEVRHIDWRVTARTGTPHSRVYTEEKEPKSQVFLSLSSDAYFGTQTTFISTRFVQIAALIGWRCRSKREQLGLQIAQQYQTPIVKDWHAFSSELARVTSIAKRGDATESFELEHSAMIKGCSIVILSDQLNMSSNARQALQRLASHNRVHWIALEDEQTFKLPSGVYSITTPQGPKTLNIQADELAKLEARYAAKQKQFNAELSALGIQRYVFDVNLSPVAIARELLHLGVIH